MISKGRVRSAGLFNFLYKKYKILINRGGYTDLVIDRSAAAHDLQADQVFYSSLPVQLLVTSRRRIEILQIHLLEKGDIPGNGVVESPTDARYPCQIGRVDVD